jgi:hypothetical protein
MVTYSKDRQLLVCHTHLLLRLVVLHTCRERQQLSSRCRLDEIGENWEVPVDSSPSLEILGIVLGDAAKGCKISRASILSNYQPSSKVFID